MSVIYEKGVLRNRIVNVFFCLIKSLLKENVSPHCNKNKWKNRIINLIKNVCKII